MSMNRRSKFFSLAGLSAIFAGVLLSFTGGVAFAHHPILDGSSSCPGADHVIEWNIGNSQAKQSMNIVSAAAVLDTNSTTYTVTGYTTPVAPSGTTTATTTVPGTLVGTLTLTVKGAWTDGHKSARSFDLVITDTCTPTATTVPTTTSPTTAPRATTTVPGDTSTTFPGDSVGPPVSDNNTTTTVCTDAVVTCPTLAFTGNDDAIPLTTGGVVALSLGVLLLVATGLGLYNNRRFGR